MGKEKLSKKEKKRLKKEKKKKKKVESPVITYFDAEAWSEGIARGAEQKYGRGLDDEDD